MKPNERIFVENYFATTHEDDPERGEIGGCCSMWTAWAVRADSKEEAAQWHNWTGAPKHDSAVLVGEIKQ